jgi:Domain of unknown function (DUF4372)
MIAVASCFSQLLSLVDRSGFTRAVKQHGAERGTKGFSCWDQFVAMLFCQMGAAHSLREICGGLATSMGKLVHLGLAKLRLALQIGIGPGSSIRRCSRICSRTARRWPRSSVAFASSIRFEAWTLPRLSCASQSMCPGKFS